MHGKPGHGPSRCAPAKHLSSSPVSTLDGPAHGAGHSPDMVKGPSSLGRCVRSQERFEVRDLKTRERQPRRDGARSTHPIHHVYNHDTAEGWTSVTTHACRAFEDLPITFNNHRIIRRTQSRRWDCISPGRVSVRSSCIRCMADQVSLLRIPDEAGNQPTHDRPEVKAYENALMLEALRWRRHCPKSS